MIGEAWHDTGYKGALGSMFINLETGEIAEQADYSHLVNPHQDSQHLVGIIRSEYGIEAA